MLKFLLSTAFILFSLSGYAQNFQPIDEGPIHEAFAQRNTGDVALDAVPSAPPNPIQERIPPKRDQQTVWIPGYWDWDNERQDFYWVTGTWRKPPPGRSWIPGLWYDAQEDGWVRVHGFWSDVAESNLTYIDQPPPDAVDENVGNPPNQNSFWLSGYWAYNASSNDYDWLEGEWQPLDPNWIMVPADYIWRPQGFVFISSYWDWPLDERGIAYSPVEVSGPRDRAVYEPKVVLETTVIIPRLLVYYPDYSCIYYHHYHYHPHFWQNYWGTPPWWGWSSWWSYSWSNTWGLWWWYTHPGYPHPHWMTAAMSQRFAPPHKKLLNKFRKVRGPDIITPHGVVKPRKFLDAIKKEDGKKGKFKPIFPANKKDRLKIDKMIEPGKEGKPLLPSGKKGDKNKNPIPKPNFDVDKKIKKGGKVREPKRPNITVPKKDVKPIIKKDDDRGKKPIIKKDDDKDRRPNIKKDDDKDRRPNIKKDDDKDRRPNIKRDDDKDRKPIIKRDDDKDRRPNIKRDDDKDRRPNIKRDDDKDRKPIIKRDDDKDRRPNIKRDDDRDRKPNINRDAKTIIKKPDVIAPQRPKDFKRDDDDNRGSKFNRGDDRGGKRDRDNDDNRPKQDRDKKQL